MLVVAVTSASVQDRAGGRAVLARLAVGFRMISLVWADGGYANSVGSTLLSWARGALDIVVEIVKGADDVKGFKILPRRWVVERSLCATRRSVCIPGSAGRNSEGGSWAR
ncbi:hypothetical protein [Streptomyces sp. NPDC059460]|uniref:hypothetical protein n=1 Tax=Streptomyces sp. NPDC059460 TaxID=3346840 RepID=UPI00369C1BB0